MNPVCPPLLSRRALLYGTACGAAALLAGCGGSKSRPEEVLPESYAGAYRFDLRRAEGESVAVRAMTVTPAGDLLLVANTRLFDDALNTSFSELRATRYTNRGQPDQTVRTDLFPPKAAPVIAGGYFDTDGVVVLEASGRLHLSTFLVDGSAAPPRIEESPIPLTVFAADGTLEGMVTLQSLAGYRVNGGRVVQLITFSVSAEGDYYALANVVSADETSNSETVIHWNQAGALIGDSAANGNTAGTTDAAGNQYGVFTDYGRATRTVPLPPKVSIIKTSPTGTKLAQIRLPDGYGAPFMVDRDGSVFVGIDGAVVVYRQTR